MKKFLPFFFFFTVFAGEPHSFLLLLLPSSCIATWPFLFVVLTWLPSVWSTDVTLIESVIGLCIVFCLFKISSLFPTFLLSSSTTIFMCSPYRIIPLDSNLYSVSALLLFPLSPEPFQVRLLFPTVLSKLLLSGLWMISSQIKWSILRPHFTRLVSSICHSCSLAPSQNSFLTWPQGHYILLVSFYVTGSSSVSFAGSFSLLWPLIVGVLQGSLSIALFFLGDPI